MTTATMNTSWAAAAGNAVVNFAARLCWEGLKLVSRRPLETLTVAVFTYGAALGANNALFGQNGPHPAPFFMETASVATPKAVPDVEPRTQPIIPLPLLTERPEPTPTFSVLPTPEPEPVTAPEEVVIGNADVAAMQEKLKTLGFFDDTVDGYYGPKTAAAIKAFEAATGLEPNGALTEDAMAAVMAYDGPVQPLNEPAPQAVAPVPTPDPVADLIAPSTVETPTVIEPAALQELQVAAVEETPALATTVTITSPALDGELVRLVQTGLSRLGFLHAQVNGVFDAETARAIREFENYNNYRVTGELAPELVDLLMNAGAYN